LYDIIIIGGGPGGSSCALTLRESGFRILLIDKSTFPRDKICGDAIPGRAVKVLNEIAPVFGQRFDAFSEKETTHFSNIFIDNKERFKINWKNKAYNAQRIHFDNFLHQAVKETTSTEIIENFKVDTIQRTDFGFKVGNAKSKQFFETKMLVGADGAQSVVARQVTNFKISLQDNVAAVRVYYKNVKGLHQNSTEFYISKKYPSAYFWIFPVAENLANVGVGMLSSNISKQNIKLRILLDEWISQSKSLQNRLADAERITKIQGFGLPLGTRRVPMSGNNFVLIGDAASLIDPIGGHGIDTAMLSGQLAGQQIIKAFKQQDFSENHFKNYETELFQHIGKDFQKKTKALRWAGRYPKLSVALMNFASFFYK
jgi:geranylgeranyl reductase family protein